MTCGSRYCTGESDDKSCLWDSRWLQIPDSDSRSYFKRIRHLGFRCDTYCELRLKVSYGGGD